MWFGPTSNTSISISHHEPQREWNSYLWLFHLLFGMTGEVITGSWSIGQSLCPPGCSTLFQQHNYAYLTENNVATVHWVRANVYICEWPIALNMLCTSESTLFCYNSTSLEFLCQNSTQLYNMFMHNNYCLLHVIHLLCSLWLDSLLCYIRDTKVAMLMAQPAASLSS